MPILKLRLVAFAAACNAALLTAPTQAATSTGSLTVTATVASTCSVNSPTLAFGTYNPASVSDSTTDISVTCTNTTPYTVGLDAGSGTGASVTDRKMMNGANLLNYTLYSDAGRTANWGNTTGVWKSATGNGAAQVHTVYGRIPASQYVDPGSYSDTVVITVTY